LHDTACCVRQTMDFPELKSPFLISEINDFDLTMALNSLSLTEQKTAELKSCLVRDSLSTQVAVLAAAEALQQAELHSIPLDPQRIGVIIAGGNLSQLQQWQQFQKHTTCSLDFVAPSWSLQFLDSHLLSIISNALTLQGPGITTSAASASSHAALMQGSQWVQLGVVDACFVVGAMTELSPLEWQSLVNVGALGGYSFTGFPEKACRPFDLAHEGFIPGQAAACVVLESQTSRIKRNVQSQGQLLSVVMGMDAARLPEPNLQGEIRVMEYALAQAQVHIKDIDYINTHGTSTPKGDEVELNAISTLFNEKKFMPWINSTKGITGHCLWSAGIVELIATLLQMQNKFLHGNRNLKNPIRDMSHLVGEYQQSATIEYALSNAFGFGGINSSLVVRKG